MLAPPHAHSSCPDSIWNTNQQFLGFLGGYSCYCLLLLMNSYVSRSPNNPQSYQKKTCLCQNWEHTNASALGEQNLPNHASKDI